MSSFLRISALAITALVAVPIAVRAGTPPDGKARAAAPSPTWKSVDKLIEQQKFDEALGQATRLREAAEAAGDEEGVTRGLIRETQLRISVGGHETALGALRAARWPREGLSRLVLELYWGESLINYLSQYRWEIGRRERTEGAAPGEFRKWTQEQIVAEARRSWDEAWRQRASLGDKPVATLSEYLAPNDYPKHIRPTLRDAVSYLAAALLADSANWTPEQSNELYRLDVAALVGAAKPGAGEIRLDDPALHPLAIAAAVLDDLEAFHRGRGEPEAALEAHLERVRLVAASFDGESDRALLRGDLQAHLAATRKYPWWAMGMAELAAMHQRAQDLKEAHAVCSEARRAYPDSPGGARCLATIKEIELPDFQLGSMLADAPGKRSLLVTHKNLKAVYFRAFAWDVQKHVGSQGGASDLLPGYAETQKILKQKPVAEWTAALPDTPDYKLHRTYVTPPLVARGFYVVAASARADFADKKNRVIAADFILGDLVLVTRSEHENVDVTALSGESGKPVPGVEVTLWRALWGKPTALFQRQVTAADGRARFKREGEGAFFATARAGDEFAFDASADWNTNEPAPETYATALIYTDRSIYRPQQKIRFKVIAFKRTPGSARFPIEPNAAVAVSLKDANGEVVETRTLKTNSFGSAAGEFAIPSGRLLGNWTIDTDRRDGGAWVRVEEYKRPTFEVSLAAPEGAVRLNQPVTVTGEARYYFGLPVSSGAVRWRVVREPVYPWWWEFHHFQVERGPSQTIAVGAAQLEKDGRFKVVFTPAADERRAADKDVSYRYTLSADLTDEGGETRSATRTLRAGFVSVEASIDATTTFFVAGRPVEVSIARKNLDGQPRAGRGTYRLVALAQPDKTVPPADLPEPRPATPGAFQTAGDLLTPRWMANFNPEAEMARWGVGAERAHGELSHDLTGAATVSLGPLSPGAYRLLYDTTDEFGARFETFKDLLVAAPAGHATPVALPLLLLAERANVAVGEPARFLALSGLPDQPLFFDVFRDGVLVERRTLDAKSGSLVELSSDEARRGGFAVRLWAVRDHQIMQAERTLTVPWDNKGLDVSFSTFRDKMRPGAHETFRVHVKARDGHGAEAGAAEVLAYMYDRSLDLFAPHNPPQPLRLFPTFDEVGQQRATLGYAPTMQAVSDPLGVVPPYKEFNSDRLKFYLQDRTIGMGNLGTIGRGGGGGGMGRGRSGGVMYKPMAAPMVSTGKDKAVGALEPLAVEGRKPEDVPAAGAQTAEPIRRNFDETAFFAPQLVTDGKGEVAVEFTVPDSVTAWTVWAHAVTRDFRSGSVKAETRTVKELMVRPYLPRFFREGDSAELKVVVNNASDRPIKGRVSFDVLDPDTQENLNALFGIKDNGRDFSAPAGGGTHVSFAVTAPRRVGPVAVRAVAKSDHFSDGELRPLPVLPSRMHLAQSRFVTLKDAQKREMVFSDLAANDDPSRVNEALVVTLDAQLFYTVLKALPYLTEYPYECTEQTLNRFVSTGIVSSLFGKYPAVAKMAAEFAKRKTQLETWDSVDPDRKMTLEESPWLAEARGGEDKQLVNVLDARVATAQRDEALAKLTKAQSGDGGFPWFAGGPSSDYMTLYLALGFARAAEFGVSVPADVVRRAWGYLGRHFHSYYANKKKEQWDVEYLTLLIYAASSYPSASWTLAPNPNDAFTVEERRAVLDFCFAHWKDRSPYTKALLALTLKRNGRAKDAELVFASVMDTAKTLPDQGTFWQPEERSWLWYNDTIESQALALRTLGEVFPADERQDGLVLWLLLNKKLNHWKSTRATAEVLYSLVKYLEKQGTLAGREEASVQAGGVTTPFVFEPDHYAGQARVLVPGARVDTRASRVVVEQKTRGHMFASATWHFSTEQLPSEARGDFFSVSRRYFKRDHAGKEIVLRPLGAGEKLMPGDEVEVQLSLKSKHAAEYVHLRDPRAAGLEPDAAVSRYRSDLGIGWYEEIRDSGTNFFFEQLPAGEYTFKYRLRANLAGDFRVGPATVQSMYAPEFTAYSEGAVLHVAGN